MATKTDRAVDTGKVSKALEATEGTMRPGLTLAGLLKTDTVKRRFEDVLGKKAPAFMSSILSAVTINPQLQQADPMTIISAAAVAASLDLPINASLGFAHIVPYSGRAQFQMGWRGFVQLAQRTGQYQTMNVTEVFEGQIVKNDPFTGIMQFNPEGKTSDKIIGYVAYFKLLSGFEKYLYMTEEQVRAHGKRYAKSFDSSAGQWKNNFPAMAKKTLIKLLLSKWAPLSVEMQKAITFDQAVVTTDERPEYIDATTAKDTPATISDEPFLAESDGGPAWVDEGGRESK